MVKGSRREGANGRSKSQENLSATTAGAHLLEVLQDGFAGLLREGGVFLCSAWFGTRDGEDLSRCQSTFSKHILRTSPARNP